MVTEAGFLWGLGIGLLICLLSHYWQRLQWLNILQQFKIQAVSTPLPIRVHTLLSQQIQEQKRLKARIVHWRDILTVAPLAYIEVDADRLCCWSNQAAQELLGVIPQPGRLLIEVVRSYELDCLVDDVQASESPTQREWLHTVIQATGQSQRLPLRGYGFPLAENHVGIFIENRHEVKTLRDERDRWASDVAHELKTPLTSLRLVAETLQERVDPSLRSWVDRLLAETVRLSLLVQELLELNRLSLAPTGELERAPLDLVTLVGRAWQNLEPLVETRQIHLAYDGPSSLPYLGNEAQLFRLVLNLLDNACKYSPPKGQITVQVRLAPAAPEQVAGITLTVKDQGPGFPSQDLPYIFERFFRADPARSRQITEVPGKLGAGSGLPISSGSGLGLAIVQQIVECHRGRISARNDPMTGGAVISLWLPQAVMPI